MDCISMGAQRIMEDIVTMTKIMHTRYVNKHGESPKCKVCRIHLAVGTKIRRMKSSHKVRYYCTKHGGPAA